MKLSEIFKLSTSKDNCIMDRNVYGLSFISNQINNDYIFVAVKGKYNDGINYVNNAISNGACAIVCDKKSNITDDIIDICNQKHVPLFIVENAEIEASKIAKLLYPKEPKNIYAITGTNGKTTIADFTEQLLNSIGITDTATIGTMGVRSTNKKYLKVINEVNEMIGINPLTTQDTITNHKIIHMLACAGIDYLIMEASSDGILRHRLDNISFGACGISNLSEDHLITHETIENYFFAKMQLFNKLQNEGSAIFNTDDQYSDKFRKYINELNKLKKINIIEYGENVECIQNSIKLENCIYKNNSYNITLNIFGTLYKTKLNLLGEFQVYNALNALAFVLSDKNINIQKAVNAINDLKTVNGHMEKVATTKTGADVYVDYAHNSEALRNALLQLRPITKNRLISVSGISSGKAEQRYYTAHVAGTFADIVIFTYLSPRFEDVDTMIEKQQKLYPKGIHGGKTRYDAIKKAINLSEKGDVILINGQGHEKFIIEYGKEIPFYDPDVVKQIISEQN